MARRSIPPAIRWTAAGTAAAVSAWCAWAGIAWLRYGRSKPHAPSDPLLDRFIPDYEVAVRHQTRVTAPAEITFPAACALDLRQSAIVQAIFRGRELLLGVRPESELPPEPLLNWAQALGWRVLAQIPGREIVLGAATRPWESKVVFRPLDPDGFADFNEPGYVKIVWTIVADPAGANQSVVRTETRVTTTDPASRARFRRYWAFLSPGMILIRFAALRMVKKEAERSAHEPAARPMHSGCVRQ